ncbi:hypothetical protein EJ04DRAFT_512244 [Polyplosphaeria fusca]|uniref:DUF4440 domain-containing protein n=1 Tax=Polyplosphaeria fusca TaxID=682080 RepID=A0A9P4R0Z7_9PLEO|nr:hypothetical protein EJ04DRAFT_512244 [Polyplosphaeria fusca]
MADEKTAVLETIRSFLAAASANTTSLAGCYPYILPSGFMFNIRPDNPIQLTLADSLARVEKQLQTLNAQSWSESLREPLEVWIHDDIAAVWSGCDISINGQTVRSGINAFTLLKVPDEGAQNWKIAGVADTQWAAGDPAPAMSDNVTPELMAPIEDFFARLRKRDWEGLLAVLLPGGGMSRARAGEQASHFMWPEFVEMLKGLVETFPKEVDINERVFDIEAKVCGDLAMVWTPFVVEYDGIVKRRGVNVWWLWMKEGKWVISGCQDTGKPA